ncbi:MAG: hypothetical protein MI743_19580 [Sneathiellales bacterium]|nr:hypothetical protein [Sneathiellales bacterium]
MFEIIEFKGHDNGTIELHAYTLENYLFEENKDGNLLQQRKKAFREQLDKINDHPIWRHCNVNNKAAILKKLHAMDEESWSHMFSPENLELAFQFYIYSHAISPEEKIKRQKIVDEQIERSCLTNELQKTLHYFFDNWGFLYRTGSLQWVIRLLVAVALKTIGGERFTGKKASTGGAKYQLGDGWKIAAGAEYKKQCDAIQKILQAAVPRVRADLEAASNLTHDIVMRSGHSFSFNETKNNAEKIVSIVQKPKPLQSRRRKKGTSKSGKKISLLKRYTSYCQFANSVHDTLAAKNAHAIQRMMLDYLPLFFKYSDNKNKMKETFEKVTLLAEEDEIQRVQRAMGATIVVLERDIFTGVLVEQCRQVAQSMAQYRESQTNATLNEIFSLVKLQPLDVQKMLTAPLEKMNATQKRQRMMTQAAADSAMQELLDEIAREKELERSRSRKKRKAGKSTVSSEKVISEPRRQSKEVEKSAPDKSRLAKNLQIVGLQQGILFRIDELGGASLQLDGDFQERLKKISEEQSEPFQACLKEIENCKASLIKKMQSLKADPVSDQAMHEAAETIPLADNVIADARQFIHRVARANRKEQAERKFHSDLMGLLKREPLFAGRLDGGRLSFHGLTFADIAERYHGYRYKPTKRVMIAGKLRPLNTNEALVLYVTFSSRTEGVSFCISVGLWTLRLPDDPQASRSDRHYQISETNRENKIDPAIWKYTGQRMAVLHVGAAKSL